MEQIYIDGNALHQLQSEVLKQAETETKKQMRDIWDKWKRAQGDRPHAAEAMGEIMDVSAPVAGMIKWTIQKKTGTAPAFKHTLDIGVELTDALVDFVSAFVERKIAEGMAAATNGGGNSAGQPGGKEREPCL